VGVNTVFYAKGETVMAQCPKCFERTETTYSFVRGSYHCKMCGHEWDKTS